MIIVPASTSVIKHVFVQDSTVTTGAGKTALVHSDITAYYVRAGGTLTAMTMETISTLGTWASSGDNYLGFKLLHDTNAPGMYELHLPNNILAAGANQVTIQLRATNAFCAPIEIQLKNVPSDAKAINGVATTSVTTVNANVGTTGVVTFTVAGDVDANVQTWAGTATTLNGTTSKPDVDVFGISGNATAADNCQADYDGTGYAGGTIVKTANVTKINSDATAAAQLAKSAATIVEGTVDNTAHTPTTTEFEADDITTAATDHYKGRIVIFQRTDGGTLEFQATDITAYSLSSGRGHFTVTALTSAPANNAKFVIV